ncbi:MAG: hypothetical protein GTO41_06595 [Burkholderiales bacterium]|nr:hypothetical protein [Burkholderiales bacterium]
MLWGGSRFSESDGLIDRLDCFVEPSGGRVGDGQRVEKVGIVEFRCCAGFLRNSDGFFRIAEAIIR